MSVRNVPANKLKKGNYFIIDGEPCQVLEIEHSKAGKHGHAKNRVTAIGLFDKKKRSIILTSGSMVQVPEIIKKSAQITDINSEVVTAMDLETYEVIELDWPDEESERKKLEELMNNPDKIGNATVEYWNVVGKNIIRRVVISS